MRFSIFDICQNLRAEKFASCVISSLLLNMIWPAIYACETFWKFWYLIFATIILEVFVLKFLLRFSWLKSVIASTVGNCVSGFFGTVAMMFGMIVWHGIADCLVSQGTFSTVNWYATFILMCIGSVFFEALSIKLIYKEKTKRIFPAMLTGNALSYTFIAFVMMTKTDKDLGEVRTENLCQKAIYKTSDRFLEVERQKIKDRKDFEFAFHDPLHCT